MLRTAFLYALCVLCSLTALAQDPSYRTTLNKLLGQTKEKLNIEACQKFNLNPAEIFNTIKYRTTFSEKCDLQGEVGIKLLAPFPIKMEVRNLSHYKLIQGTGKINLGMENPPKILAEIIQGQLKGKDTIYFNAYYSGELLPASTLRVKPGTESIKVEVYEKGFSKIKDTFNIKVK